MESSNGVADLHLWLSDDELHEKLVNCSTGAPSLKSKSASLAEEEPEQLHIERPVKIEFIDMPYFYHYDDPLCFELFGELAHTE